MQMQVAEQLKLFIMQLLLCYEIYNILYVIVLYAIVANG